MNREEKNKLKDHYRSRRKETIEAIITLIKYFWFRFIRFYWLLDIIFFLIDKDKEILDKLTDEQYSDIFIKGRSKSDIEKSYNKAWEAKNFEIDNYWKRATYFWAFQVASFSGYILILNSTNYQATPVRHPQVLYFIICIGYITSIAWALINRGSKIWQRHWEIHVDMLEDAITGPLYKIVTTQKTFSVSKINDLVSRFFVCIWLLLTLKYFIDHLTLNPFSNVGIDWLIVFATILILYFTGAMYWGYGRGRFGERKVKFFARKFKPQ